MSNDNGRFLYKTSPLAWPDSVIQGRCYRFTVLTPSLIRLEYSADGVFEDRASQCVFFRDFPSCAYTTCTESGKLSIETEALTITYCENAPFSEQTLQIQLKVEPATVWHYGDDFDDLGGTARTLDKANGAIPLQRGVCSRGGFSVLDDSHTMLLNENGWVEVRTPDTVDCYFFGYGYAYRDAVRDFYRLTGAPPLLPAHALGNWWSRYHKYTQQEYQDLIKRFEAEEIPFSVSVVDMDWHITEIPEELKDPDPRLSDGWTGYSWNKELFPDYKAFLRFLHDHNLKTALNLHPASGVCCHEDMYEEMAQACGVDPATRQHIPLDILSPAFMEKYFDILHHPYEEAGVDFWWMDWQQGTDYWWIHEPNTDSHMQDEREVLDPLWMLNHLHIADIQRSGKRALFFSRYSGPGSHRYPVGFSGDTYVTWASLDFQPYFTATASNIGYGWWSHDIGGHMFGYTDEELTVRWMQLGVFSPINRLHSANIPFIRKEPWCFEAPYDDMIRHWLRLRHQLFPYIYTMNERCHTQLEPLVQPMYYAYPKSNGAYEAKNQYMFGSELMVAPITAPKNAVTQMGSVDVWLPSGDWFDFFSGLHYRGAGETVRVHRALKDYPVFAKAGAIVPSQTDYKLEPAEEITVTVFPGADNTFVLYEDAGDGKDYTNGACTRTAMQLVWGEKPVFTIKPAVGMLTLLPQQRKWTVKLRGFTGEIEPIVYVDECIVPTECCYDEPTRTMSVTITASIKSSVCVELDEEHLITGNGDCLQRVRAVLQRAHCDVMLKMDLMKILADGTLSAAEKAHQMNLRAANGQEYDTLLSALHEQIDVLFVS